jgi:maleylacetoacetate isomerase/maleylpyruvate isomerase
VKLYTYWRSTSSYRVRSALALKGVEAEHAFVHLVRDGGEQNSESYHAINPQGRVPTLVLEDGTILTQSPAIIEYLDEAFPTPAFLPSDPALRAQVRSVAAIISCDIHALHNVSTLNYLRGPLSQPDSAVTDWIVTWISRGLEAIEAKLGNDGCYRAVKLAAEGLLGVSWRPRSQQAERLTSSLRSPKLPVCSRPRICHCLRAATLSGANHLITRAAASLPP